jgi:hypothetical protein
MIDLAKLIAIDEADPTHGGWEVGGPFPAVSVIVCIDGGCGGEYPEPPCYECVCTIDEGREGATERNPLAVAIAEVIVASRNAFRELLETNRDLRGLVNILAGRLAYYTGGTVPGEIESAKHPREEEL